MTLFQIIFFFFFAFALIGALFILFSKDVLYSAFALLLTLVSVAALFILAGADFIGITQIMIYVGGILVLILFGIMMTRRLTGEDQQKTSHNHLYSGLFTGVLLLTFLIVLIIKLNNSIFINKNEIDFLDSSTVSSIGIGLMTQYILPFEIAGLILMIALIGAAFIAAQVVKRKA